jgi:hypothetical protein
MGAIQAFIRRHPESAYFSVTFAISWGAALLAIGSKGGMQGTTPKRRGRGADSTHYRPCRPSRLSRSSPHLASTRQVVSGGSPHGTSGDAYDAGGAVAHLC